MNMKGENIVLLLLVSVCSVSVSCVQYFDHPVNIPSGRVSGRSSDEWADRAVQFLVRDGKDGSYHFGFDTGGSPNPTIYREEIRERSGRVVGRYAYVDPDGILRITEYEADHNGFRSTESQRILFDSLSELQLIGPIPKPITKQFKSLPLKVS